jgi:ABC-type nitrate/sulfonate/bicarbonate transport system substrate-binding protein
VIISQFTAMMRQIEYPANRLLLVLNQLKQEKNQNLINAVVAALKQAINTYLSSETVPSFSKACASFFITKATSETDT